MVKLNIETAKIERARSYAGEIASSFQGLIEQNSSVTIERTVARLMGIDGAIANGEPLPNILIDDLKSKDVLNRGAAYWIANGMLAKNIDAQELAEAAAEGLLDLTALPAQPDAKVFSLLNKLTSEALKKISRQRSYREEAYRHYGKRNIPAIYVIVATGNVYEDVIQAKAAVRQGADIIAIIRSTAQSLLDYVPYGATTTGFGGTFATQENFRIVREALDEVGEEVGRYISLTNYASGLCMPEIAVMGALERLDVMLNDAMYGILFRDINMKRTFLDQYFSRMINAYAGIEIQTGEDNYLTTSDAIEKAYTVTASQFINEQFALISGVRPDKMGLGHAFEIDPEIENSLLYETAHALLTRELFPDSPVKYMPPTRHITGNIFKAYLMNGIFNFVAQFTGQSVQLLGMMTEAIHTPYMADRALAIDNAQYTFKAARSFNREFVLKQDGFIIKRANEVLEQATDFLEKVKDIGLMQALSDGVFANIKRGEFDGKGLDGLFYKADNYLNPFMDRMKTDLGLDTGEEKPLSNLETVSLNFKKSGKSQKRADSSPSSHNLIKPYGDTLNDGRIQVSFTLPTEANEKGKEAAKIILKQMGLQDIEICYSKELSKGFAHFIGYATSNASADLDKIRVKAIEIPKMDMEQIDEYIENGIGREIKVVGACIESDAHTVGIDAIMNMKGFSGHYGLERYRFFSTVNMGAQIPVEVLIKKAIDFEADAILVSQVVTQRNIHITNLTKLIELAEAEGVRDKMLFICGGPRINHELAIELGYDAGFGSGTFANDVAFFIAKQITEKVMKRT